MPFLLLFFVACAGYIAIKGDWFAAGWFAICAGWGGFGMRLNRRRISELELG